MKRSPVYVLVWVFILCAMADIRADRYDHLFPASTKSGDITLERKGVSQLTVGYIFKVYAAAFYQEAALGPVDALSDRPRHLEIHYLRNISRDAFIEAAEDMLAQQHSAAEIDSIRPGIQQINGLYQDVKTGDRYALTYTPGTGTELFFNGQSKGVIPGAAFARIYFSIWLGAEHPYQEFRDRLVGLK